MKFAAVFAAIISLAFLTSCGSSGGGSSSVVTPVQASSSYSVSSIEGTYAFTGSSWVEGGYYGTLTMDGNGNITTGSISYVWTNGAPPVTCTAQIAGTYTMNSSGTGTLEWTVAPAVANSASCGTYGFLASSSTSVGNFTLLAASSGSTLMMVGNGALLAPAQENVSTLTAFKQ